MATFKQRISKTMTARAVVVIEPRSSGWKLPRRPASTAESRMYVTTAMVGMYKSGELISSRGGRKIEEYCCCEIWPLGPVAVEVNRAC